MKYPAQLVASADYLYRTLGDGHTVQRRRHDWAGSVRWETITNEDHAIGDVPAAKGRRVSVSKQGPRKHRE